MKSNTIAYNFIAGTRTNLSAGISDGIGISSENALCPYGLRPGNKIYGNVVRDCSVGSGLRYQGVGILCNSPDYVEIFNNTVSGGSIGIDLEVALTNSPPSAKVVNNIVVNPSSSYCYIVGSGVVTNLTVDYNLYYPTTSLTNQITVYPNINHDLHSVLSNPLFVSASPLAATDFRLKSGSPGVGAGTPVGLVEDFGGTTIPTNAAPDIGAFQIQRPLPPPDFHVISGP
jgi:hypothetical protein